MSEEGTELTRKARRNERLRRDAGGREPTVREMIEWLQNRPGAYWEAILNDARYYLQDVRGKPSPGDAPGGDVLGALRRAAADLDDLAGDFPNTTTYAADARTLSELREALAGLVPNESLVCRYSLQPAPDRSRCHGGVSDCAPCRLAALLERSAE